MEPLLFPGPHAVLETAAAVLGRAFGDPVISTQQCMFYNYRLQLPGPSTTVHAFSSVPQIHTL